MQIITLSALEKMIESGKIKQHHTSLFRGYVSRRRKDENITAAPYSGKFGKGYTVNYPNYHSTNYSYITYYIFT